MLNKSSSRSQTLLLRQHYSDLELLSDLNMGRWHPLTRSCPSCATSLYTMSATSPSWIRRRRKSSGRINYKWYGRRALLKHCTANVVQFLESFANKHISSSEDRLEETKRRKLALKAQKLVELMMVSGIPTASGYEERIRFSEMEVVDRGANEEGLLKNEPEGHSINGWDINVAGVRTTSVKRTVRYHTHAVSRLRIYLEPV